MCMLPEHSRLDPAKRNRSNPPFALELSKLQGVHKSAGFLLED
jgi:hypothetical protein